MLNIIKKAPPVALSQTRATQNDPGGSSGSGNTYEKHSQEQPKKPKLTLVHSNEQQEDASTPAIMIENSAACRANQIGLSQVLTEHISSEHSTEDKNTSGSYSGQEQSNAKGMLINVKAE